MTKLRLSELDSGVDEMLAALRKHLGMNVGFISEFIADRRYIRFVDSNGEACAVKVGDVIPLSEGYCKLIVDGLLPELMADTSEVPMAMAIHFTRTLPIGAHIGVPITLPDGRLYGTFCCYRDTPDPKLDERDLKTVKAFADLMGARLLRTWASISAHEEGRRAVLEALARNEPAIELQTIVDLKTSQTLGFESLARFTGTPKRAPNLWFEQAELLGLGQELERNAIRNGAAVFRHLPADCFLSLNCSPAMICSGGLEEALAGLPLSRIFIEVTEQELVKDFNALKEVLAPLRRAGLRTAMDDAGAGFSSLQHLLDLTPDMIKLDTSFAKMVVRDLPARALVGAMVAFAEQIGSTVVAEGIEDFEAARIFRKLGVHAAQGYFFSMPQELKSAIAASQVQPEYNWGH